MTKMNDLERDHLKKLSLFKVYILSLLLKEFKDLFSLNLLVNLNFKEIQQYLCLPTREYLHLSNHD